MNIEERINEIEKYIEKLKNNSTLSKHKKEQELSYQQGFLQALKVIKAERTRYLAVLIEDSDEEDILCTQLFGTKVDVHTYINELEILDDQYKWIMVEAQVNDQNQIIHQKYLYDIQGE